MAERSIVPPYSKEEATRWLAWLAYQMRERDMTIFEIEKLQPNWLTDETDVYPPHLLFTRLLWGMLSGLAIGVIFQIDQTILLIAYAIV